MGWGTSFEVTSYHEAGEIPLNKWNSIKPELLGVVVDNVVTEIKEHNNKVPTHDPYTNPKAIFIIPVSVGKSSIPAHIVLQS